MTKPVFYPKPGQIVMCDFTNGFIPPEMVKNRPVIVLSANLPGRSGLATVVGLSTTPPDIIQSYHCKLPKACLPRLQRFQERDTWVKGDMLYTVSFGRLESIRLGKREGKRVYFHEKLGREQMKAIYSCVLHGINLGGLIQHL